jgi:uncharacterized protein (DUF1684 family)
MRTAFRLDCLALALLALSCTKTDPETRAWQDALLSERQAKDAYVAGADGPLGDARRATFRGLRYFDPDPSWRIEARLERAANPDTVQFVTSQRTFEAYLRIGRVRFERGGREYALAVYRSIVEEKLFLPFTDATTGEESYGAGRYLDPETAPGDMLRLDFNRAYNPYCAYDARWVCPVSPPENHLEIPVRAGEKDFGHGV